MSITREPTSVDLEITVDVPVEHAFKVFTEDFDRIKPREHNMLPVDIAETVLEPRVGGRVYDCGVDGSTCQWARVLVVEPPHRLVISWDITPAFQLEPDPARCSEVEFTFTSVGPEQTHVRLEHRHLDRHGAGWQGWRDRAAGADAWGIYLERFRALAEA